MLPVHSISPSFLLSRIIGYIITGGTDFGADLAATDPLAVSEITDEGMTPTAHEASAMSAAESRNGPLLVDDPKARLRIYMDHAPVMLSYKKNIYNCVHEDNHDFIVQRMPERLDQIKHKTTCGHMYCKAENGVFEPNTYRVSVERRNDTDPAIPLGQSIPLQPLYNVSPSLIKCKLVSPTITCWKHLALKTHYHRARWDAEAR